jgi:hypothetical protein
MDYLRELEAELQPFTETLHSSLTRIDSQIESHTRELKALGAARKRITSLIRQLDPEVPKKKTPAQEIGQASYDAFVEWVMEHREKIDSNGGIFAEGLYSDPEFTVIADRSKIGKAMRRAHSDGILRIDSTGRGGRKNYKVV